MASLARGGCLRPSPGRRRRSRSRSLCSDDRSGRAYGARSPLARLASSLSGYRLPSAAPGRAWRRLGATWRRFVGTHHWRCCGRRWWVGISGCPFLEVGRPLGGRSPLEERPLLRRASRSKVPASRAISDYSVAGPLSAGIRPHRRVCGHSQRRSPSSLRNDGGRPMRPPCWANPR